MARTKRSLDGGSMMCPRSQCLPINDEIPVANTSGAPGRLCATPSSSAGSSDALKLTTRVLLEQGGSIDLDLLGSALPIFDP